MSDATEEIESCFSDLQVIQKRLEVVGQLLTEEERQRFMNNYAIVLSTGTITPTKDGHGKLHAPSTAIGKDSALYAMIEDNVKQLQKMNDERVAFKIAHDKKPIVS